LSVPSRSLAGAKAHPIGVCRIRHTPYPESAVTARFRRNANDGAELPKDTAERHSQDAARLVGTSHSVRAAFLKQFARTLKQDLLAVEAAILQKWSNGPVEGHVNRLKV
jgi:transposase